MLKTKRIQTFLSSLFLVLTLVAFSGFTGTSTNYQKPQTELVTNSNSVWSSVKKNNNLNSSQLKVSFNQYAIFSFNWFLKTKNFDFNITFKSQKETVLQFTNFNSILKQNLIAKIHTNSTYTNFIE